MYRGVMLLLIASGLVNDCPLKLNGRWAVEVVRNASYILGAIS